MPEKLQPGPLAGQISFFAPVSLFFFFFLMFIITALRGIDLHPMNYFFLATAFFAFHLLLAYLVDHMSIHAAMVISSVVSIILVVSYLRLVVGMRFAALEAGTAQLIYLVLFSYDVGRFCRQHSIPMAARGSATAPISCRSMRRSRRPRE